MVIMKFLLSLVMLKIMGFELNVIKGLELRELEFELAYVIVVIFSINHGYMMLNAHFKSIQGDLKAHMLWA